VVALAVLGAAGSGRAATAETFLPVQGGTVDQAHFALRCAGDDEYLAGIRGGTSWDPLRSFVNAFIRADGVINGVRTLGIECRRMLDLGQATAPFEVGNEEGYPVEPLFSIIPPSYDETCALRDGNGVLVKSGVANGFYGWVEPGDSGYIRTLGLGCMTLDGTETSSIQTPLSADIRQATPDFSIDCPQGEAADGIRMGISRLQNPFDSRDVMSVQLICDTYFRAPDLVPPSGPGGGAIVDQRSGVRFRWSPVDRAVIYEVCATFHSANECRRTTHTSFLVDTLVGSTVVGHRFSWSVQACALPPAPGQVKYRLCGPISKVPTGGESDALAIRFAPRRVTRVDASPGVSSFDSGSPVPIDLSFQGKPLATRYKIVVSGAPGFAQQVVPETEVTGSAHTVRLLVPLASGTAPVVLRPTVRSCAGDTTLPGHEICGSEVKANSLVADLRRHRLCRLTVGKVKSPGCPVKAKP
jgi:hypothetical protein